MLDHALAREAAFALRAVAANVIVVGRIEAYLAVGAHAIIAEHLVAVYLAGWHGRSLFSPSPMGQTVLEKYRA